MVKLKGYVAKPVAISCMVSLTGSIIIEGFDQPHVDPDLRTPFKYGDVQAIASTTTPVAGLPIVRIVRSK